jgi:TonB-linked SusC/RagA family outer membrane protein
MKKKLIFLMTAWTFILTSLLVVQATAAIYPQNARVTLSVKNTGIKKALETLERKGNIRLMYSESMLAADQTVSWSGVNVPVMDALRSLLANTGLRPKVFNRELIVLLPAGKALENIRVKGKVTSETGEPLAGVSVNISNTKTGTMTNADGYYELEVPADSRLEFSSVGYLSVSIAVENKNTLDIVLKSNIGGLSEMVVIGYGTQKKVDVTGAVDQVSGKEIENRPIANVFQGLQGLSPGLNITYAGGKPGTVPTFNIRGYTSINGGNPLIVIDGIVSTGDDLMRLNPADISSFSVLRDAASSAIYGARAAFGVILVNTKEGAKGRQVISYNTYVSSSRSTVLPDPVTNPYIYSKVLQTSTDNTPWQYIKFSDYQYQWARERSDDPSIESTRLDPTDPIHWTYMGNNNWYNYFLNKSSISFNHSLSLSGTANTTKKLPIGYYLSANYTKENGINKLTKDDWDRYALKARINLSPLAWLKLDNNLNLYQTIAANPSYSLTDIYYLRPIDNAVNPDGTWANSSAGRLAAQLVDGGRNEQKMFGFQNVIRATATFFDGDLQITGDASIKREQATNLYDYRPYSIGWGPKDIRQEGGTGSVTQVNGNISDDVYDLYLNYQKKLGSHTVSVLTGFNQESYTYPSVKSERDGLITSSLPYLGLTTGTNFVTPSYTSFATRSYFGRIGYNFREKYILEGNARYDGSSRFPSSNRWGLFPSVSGAWVASKEPFLSSLTNYVSTLKFRASYGSLGNQNVGDFNYIQTLGTTLSSYLIDGAQQTVIGNPQKPYNVAPALYVDPASYTWEKVTSRNFGTDMGFLRDKIILSFDYYVRNTTGMLVKSQPLPAVLGTDAPRQNAADLSSRGWELGIGYRDMYRVGSKPLTFSARFTLSDSRARITKYNNPQQLFSDYRQEQVLGEIWGLTNDGLFQNAGEIAKLDESAIVPWGALAIVNGWPKYKDLNGDAKIEAGLSAKDPKDLHIIGNTSARYNFGLTLNWAWDGIDLSVFLQGVGKRDYYPQHYLYWGPFQQPYAGLYKWNLDYYRGAAESPAQRAQDSKAYIKAGLADANLHSKYPVLQSWLADNNYGAGLDIPQTQYLLNAAYIRVKNVALGYTLPTVLTKRYGISRLRLYITGENIFEFSQVKKYVDPEAVNATDSWAYPFQRKYAAGLNLEF